MLTNDLAVTEIMMLVNEAIVERFLESVPDHGHGDGTIVGETSFHGRLIYKNGVNKAIPLMIKTVVTARGESKMPGPLKGNQDLPTGHVFESAIGLDPVPPLAENSGDVSAAGVPILINNALDYRQVGVMNGPFSYRDGQHDHRIIKKHRRTPAKNAGIRKLFSGDCQQANRQKVRIFADARGLK
jgi:hypothetical protein